MGKLSAAIGASVVVLILPMLAAATIATTAMPAAASCGGIPIDSPPGAVRVMAWNLWAESGNTRGHPLRDRAPYMVERILVARPDILAGQEAGASTNGPWLRNNLATATGLTPVGPTSMGNRALKLWYNAAKLEELKSGAWIAPMGRHSKGAVWARMRQRESGQEFYVLSVHLEHVANANSMRGRQMRWLLDQLTAENTAKLPVIVAGDLNTNHLRSSGNAPVELLRQTGHVNTLTASTSTPRNDDIGSALGDRGITTRNVTRPGRTQIDYIFTTRTSTVHAWALYPQAPIEDEKYVRITSDHNAIVSSITPGGITEATPIDGTTTQQADYEAEVDITDPCDANGLSTVWADGADCGFAGVENPNSCQQALNEAARIASKSACRNEVRGGTWDNRCGEFVARAYGYYNSGEPSAATHYATLKRQGLIRTSQTDIPAGALVFFSTGHQYGHVAIYAGNGKAFSNDYIRNGCIDLTPMSTMSSGGRYLGWAPPVFANGGPL